MRSALTLAGICHHAAEDRQRHAVAGIPLQRQAQGSLHARTNSVLVLAVAACLMHAGFIDACMSDAHADTRMLKLCCVCLVLEYLLS